jgi:hypothetical protein
MPFDGAPEQVVERHAPEQAVTRRLVAKGLVQDQDRA